MTLDEANQTGSQKVQVIELQNIKEGQVDKIIDTNPVPKTNELPTEDDENLISISQVVPQEFSNPKLLQRQEKQNRLMLQDNFPTYSKTPFSSQPLYDHREPVTALHSSEFILNSTSNTELLMQPQTVNKSSIMTMAQTSAHNPFNN